MRSLLVMIVGAGICLLVVSQGFGQFAIDWHTHDGGGAGGTSSSVGGGYDLAGTIGQPDASSPASPMTGGAFQLVGGFWAATQVCYCPGDMNGDGAKNGLDVTKFIGCVMSGGACACADVDAANGVNLDDVAVFVDDMLADGSCP
jgi:hypothetical protein